MFVPVLTQTRTILVASCLVGLLLLMACVPLIRDPRAAVAPSAPTVTPTLPTVPTSA